MTIIVKISNIKQENGHMDYKGLDLSKIVPGSQLYPDYDNVAYFQYAGDVTEMAGVQIITQTTYDEHKTRIENQPKPFSQEDEIAQLKQSQVEQDELIMSLLLGGM